MVGGIHGVMAGVRHYFHLGEENRQLLNYVSELTERLAEYEDAEGNATFDMLVDEEQQLKYRVMHASVVSNTVNRMENLIVLNRGIQDGVVADMMVLSPEGMLVGYVVNCTERYSVAVSVLNTKFKMMAKIRESEYSGMIQWDGTNQHKVTLEGLSKYATPEVGQEIVSSGSALFFPGIKIGTIAKSELDITGEYYTVMVDLYAHLSRLTNVLLVEKRDMNEILDLMESAR